MARRRAKLGVIKAISKYNYGIIAWIRPEQWLVCLETRSAIIKGVTLVVAGRLIGSRIHRKAHREVMARIDQVGYSYPRRSLKKHSIVHPRWNPVFEIA